ncbi:MAG TPA: efflux RND transporter permease subunit [bacterium]|nr:efflux RND transporter permease subunit [bacterium]
MNLPQFAIKRPVSMSMVFVAVLLFGGVTFTRLPVELMPNISYKTISVIINARGGIPPTEVESMITLPVEEALSNVSNLEGLSSQSETNKCTVSLRFAAGTDMNFAALEVREKFSKVKNKLPKDIEKPVIAKYEESDMPIMILAITPTKDEYTPEEIRKIVEVKIKEKLARVPGVANVDLAGGREEKIIVDVDQSRLEAYKLPMDEVTNKIGLENISLLAGSVKDTQMETKIRTSGLFTSVKEVEDVAIKTTKAGSYLKLKDIAKVKQDYAEPQGYARINTKGAVSLYIQRESSGNTVSTAEGVSEILDKIKPTLPSNLRILEVSNQAVFILDAIHEVRKHLLTGFIIVFVVLIIFFRSLFSTIIISMAVPMAMMVTFTFMYATDITINVMTLSGLALSIGMLLDNSIVVLENIFKYRERGGDPTESAITGSNQVLMSIMSGTITTIIVFVPIQFMSEQIKMLYGGLAITVTFALISSLFVALTVVPLLASKMKHVHAPAETPNRYMRLMEKYYRKTRSFMLRYRYYALVTVFLVLAGSAMTTSKIPKELTGEAESDRFTIFVELPDGAKLELSDIVVKEVEKIAASIPEVKNVQSRIEGWSSKVYVSLKPEKERTKSVEDVTEELRPLVTKLGKGQDAFIYFSGGQESGGKEIILDIYGYDYDVLKKVAVKISQIMGKIEGLADTKIRMTEGRPEYRFIVDKNKAATLGLTVKEIADEIHAKVRGLRATAFRTEGREIEILCRLDEKFRKNKKDIERISVFNKAKEMIYVEQVTNFAPGLGPSEIYRNNKSRMIGVTANVTKISLATAMLRVREALKDFEFPKDYYYEFGGNYAKMQENQKQLILAFAMSILLIYMLLASLFESYVQPLIILAAIPYAMIGAIWFIHLMHQPITMGTLIGAMVLGGIATSNSILLIVMVNSLISQGYSLNKALLVAGESRTRPIIMTASCAMGGLLPMAIAKGGSSALWAPLACTVIGGIFTATPCTLLLVPGIYAMVEDIKKLGKKKKAAEE